MERPGVDWGKGFLAPGGTARAKTLGWVYAWNVPENAKRRKWQGMMLERSVAVRSSSDWGGGGVPLVGFD